MCDCSGDLEVVLVVFFVEYMPVHEHFTFLAHPLTRTHTHTHTHVCVSHPTTNKIQQQTHNHPLGSTLAEHLRDPNSPTSSWSNTAMQEVTHHTVNMLLNQLPHKEARVVRLVYGLENGRPMQYRDVCVGGCGVVCVWLWCCVWVVVYVCGCVCVRGPVHG